MDFEANFSVHGKKKEGAVYLCLLTDLGLRVLWLFTAQTLAFSLQENLLCLKEKKIKQQQKSNTDKKF